MVLVSYIIWIGQQKQILYIYYKVRNIHLFIYCLVLYISYMYFSVLLFLLLAKKFGS